MMRTVLFYLFVCLLALTPAAAQSATSGNVAEQFVSEEIRSGVLILTDSRLAPADRRAKFEDFMLRNTDLNRIALFTMGDAARSATPVQRDAFIAAFRIYATAAYKSYFQLYGGQSLTVSGSDAHGPGDTIVHTQMANTGGGAPLTVDFRIRTDGLKPLVTDIGFAGIWIAITQRDDFAGYLAHNGGNIDALTAHLNDVAKMVH